MTCMHRLYNKGIDHITNKGILKGWITAKNKRLLVILKKNNFGFRLRFGKTNKSERKEINEENMFW